MTPIVAIVGRPNVGKSTLFNRLIRRRLAIVEAEPGVTRDRIYSVAGWGGREFTLVDTGGLDFGVDGDLQAAVRRQAQAAIDEADLVLFLVDARAGLNPGDHEVAEVLRRSNRPVILVANKADSAELAAHAAEFYALGLGEPVPVSAEHGVGTGELLDRVLNELPPADGEPAEEPAALRIAIVGRPNVGKSSLLNSILGQERLIVAPEPGTTRDAVDVAVRQGDRELVLIDTAGLRRKARVEHPVERYGVLRALRAVDRADVVFLVLDATQPLAEQDQRIAGYVHEAGRASIVVFNKWDLVEPGEEPRRAATRAARDRLRFLAYAPLAFVSARTGRGVTRLLDLAERVGREYRKTVSTPDLNRLVREAVTLTPPPAERGKRLKIYYAAQAGSGPPRFIFFVNDPELAHFSYQRYLENRLRQAYGFEGTPIRLVFRSRR